MFDPEDKTASLAAVRELAEETGINRSREAPLNLHEMLKWFKTITVSFGEVYTGYSDDPRNTDNAWMETSAYLWLVKKGVNFHIDKKGEDTVKVGWFEITPDLLGNRPVHGKKLFASHSFILRKAVRELLRQRY
jgi:ADP-ribose pyrophosphatase